MVLVLYVLAGVMAAGGLIAIYSGSDIIVMERGWTMVIAGSVFTACGAVLAGIATAVAHLQALHGEFARVSERLGRPQTPSFAPLLDTPPQATLSGERTNPPPLSTGPEIKEHRDLDIVPEPILSAPPAPEPVAGPLPAAETSEKREPAAVPDLDASLFEREPGPETSLAEVKTDAAKTDAAGAPPATIVGTYNSGGNFYVMYSDGSIEAETPAGKFRFDSLDELKEFIAAGGDKAKATS
jgi:hypothetical protein